MLSMMRFTFAALIVALFAVALIFIAPAMAVSQPDPTAAPTDDPTVEPTAADTDEPDPTDPATVEPTAAETESPEPADDPEATEYPTDWPTPFVPTEPTMQYPTVCPPEECPDPTIEVTFDPSTPNPVEDLSGDGIEAASPTPDPCQHDPRVAEPQPWPPVTCPNIPAETIEPPAETVEPEPTE